MLLFVVQDLSVLIVNYLLCISNFEPQSLCDICGLPGLLQIYQRVLQLLLPSIFEYLLDGD